MQTESDIKPTDKSVIKERIIFLTTISCVSLLMFIFLAAALVSPETLFWGAVIQLIGAVVSSTTFILAMRSLASGMMSFIEQKKQ